MRRPLRAALFALSCSASLSGGLLFAQAPDWSPRPFAAPANAQPIGSLASRNERPAAAAERTTQPRLAADNRTTGNYAGYAGNASAVTANPSVNPAMARRMTTDPSANAAAASKRLSDQSSEGGMVVRWTTNSLVAAENQATQRTITGYQRPTGPANPTTTTPATGRERLVASAPETTSLRPASVQTAQWQDNSSIDSNAVRPAQFEVPSSGMPVPPIVHRSQIDDHSSMPTFVPNTPVRAQQNPSGAEGYTLPSILAAPTSPTGAIQDNNPQLPERSIQQPPLRPDAIEAPPVPPGNTRPDFPPLDRSDISPSDQNRQPQVPLQRDAPGPEITNCDTVRDRALADDITNIRLNRTPIFGMGVTNIKESETEKNSVLRDTEMRSWSDYRGRTIAEGRMVDMVFDQVHIEMSNGQRRAINLSDLSDPDRAYALELWKLPMLCSLGNQPIIARQHVPGTVTYQASGLCHNPLYFEDVQLERYGHEHGPILQPVLSTAHFFTNVAILPYKMGIHPPNECQYALGYYRPGSCAPWTVGPFPISLRGALAEGALIGIAAPIFP